MQGNKGVIVMRRLWVRSPFERMNYYLIIFSFLRSGIKAKSVTQNVMPRKIRSCLNTTFPPQGTVKLI